MKTLEFKYLVGNEYICPYVTETFDFIYEDSKGRLLIDEFINLYEAINYTFSSPGNSERRRLINDINWPYCSYASKIKKDFYNLSKRNESLNEEHAKRYELLNVEHDSLIEKLLHKAAKHKFRTLTDEQLLLLSPVNYPNGCLLYSSNLNTDGMITTMDSFIDIPQSILDNLYFE